MGDDVNRAPAVRVGVTEAGLPGRPRAGREAISRGRCLLGPPGVTSAESWAGPREPAKEGVGTHQVASGMRQKSRGWTGSLAQICPSLVAHLRGPRRLREAVLGGPGVRQLCDWEPTERGGGVGAGTNAAVWPRQWRPRGSRLGPPPTHTGEAGLAEQKLVPAPWDP